MSNLEHIGNNGDIVTDDQAELIELEEFIRINWVDDNGDELDDESVQEAAVRMQQLRKDVAAAYAKSGDTEKTR